MDHVRGGEEPNRSAKFEIDTSSPSIPRRSISKDSVHNARLENVAAYNSEPRKACRGAAVVVVDSTNVVARSGTGESFMRVAAHSPRVGFLPPYKKVTHV